MKVVLVLFAIIGLGLGAPQRQGLVQHKGFAVKISPRNLSDDFLDFLALIPFDDITAINEAHLKNDGAEAAVLLYLQGPEWAALVEEVGGKPAVQDFLQYLTDAGLPIVDVIAYIHELINSAVPEVPPDENGSLRPLLDEIEAIIPFDDLIALLDDKLQNSPDFQNLYVQISSEDARALVEEVRAIPEVQRLAQRLRDFSVRVDEALALLYGWLGWGVPVKISPRSLSDDFLDFLALIPFDDITAINEAHLKNDGAEAAVLLYLQGPEWAALVEEVGGKPAVQDFLQYLTDAGLPIVDVIAYIHELINSAVPEVPPDENGSLRPLLDEIEAIIPFDDLIALLDDKLQNSPDFQNLYVQISSEDARALVEEVRAIPEVQRLAQRLRDFSVRVDEALALLYGWLGWGVPKV